MNDALAQFFIMADQRLNCARNCGFRKPAHLGNQAAQLGDFIVKCLDGVILGHARCS
jgi:hypothetical protein